VEQGRGDLVVQEAIDGTFFAQGFSTIVEEKGEYSDGNLALTKS
jgi:hypothetical protein